MLALAGPSWAALGGAVLVDNVASNLASTAFVAYLLSRCDPSVSATQYALLTSLSSLAARLLGFAGALLATRAGWSALWLATAAAAFPALMLVRWLPAGDARRPG
jgi:PAT family beta-lactamase induction signal transducer AmpG